jgi:hypothetical protein
MHLLALVIVGGSVYFLWAYTSPVYGGAVCGSAVACGRPWNFSSDASAAVRRELMDSKPVAWASVRE